MVKLTDWFDSNTNPVHVGVYQVDRGKLGIWYRKWTGTGWNLCDIEVKAADKINRPSTIGSLPWRGLSY